ncbi:hypothetical protein [Marinobacter salarius]
MTQLSFDRNIDELLASATNEGVLIVAVWTVGIPKDDAVKYVQNYDRSPAEGFFKHDDQVILSHGAGKIYLSNTEADAIVELIREAYM